MHVYLAKIIKFNYGEKYPVGFTYLNNSFFEQKMVLTESNHRIPECVLLRDENLNYIMSDASFMTNATVFSVCPDQWWTDTFCKIHGWTVRMQVRCSS